MTLVAGNDAEFRAALAARNASGPVTLSDAPAVHTRSRQSEIVVSTDADFRDYMGAREMADFYGRILAAEYPGYRWYVEPHPHPTHPFVDIRLEGGGGPLGFTICPKKHFSYTELRKFTIMQGGECLERHLLNRRRLDEAEFLSRPKTFAGLFLPYLDGVAL